MSYTLLAPSYRGLDETHLSYAMNDRPSAPIDSPTSTSMVPSEDSSPFTSRLTSSKLFSSPTKSPRTSNTVVSSSWVLEIQNLRQSRSAFEVTISLRTIRGILSGIEKQDRIQFCKKDVIDTLKYLKRKRRVWSSELFSEFASILTTYFDESRFRVLPAFVIQEILQYLQLSDFANVPAVCKDLKTICYSDEVWSVFYAHRFLRHNPLTQPAINYDYMRLFKERFQDPQIGDRVEVSWNGKFRLESSDVYFGLAWWVGVVVDKHSAHKKYKIHYPGWDARWDEWVPKSRLRWTVERNDVETIQVNDIVELWCCGTSVPGAWLESYVRKVRDGKYCVGRVMTSGNLWVDRDRLRLVKRHVDLSENRPRITFREELRDRLQRLSRRLSRSRYDDEEEDRSCIMM